MYKQIIAGLSAGLFILSGCGGDSVDSSVNDPKKITMQVNEEIAVHAGDSFNPTSPDARIKVRHVLGAEKKYITLLSGSAELIRGNYVAE